VGDSCTGCQIEPLRTSPLGGPRSIRVYQECKLGQSNGSFFKSAGWTSVMTLLGDSSPPDYYTSICVRSCCTRRASCVDLINKTKKQYITIPQYWFNKTKQHTHTPVCVPDVLGALVCGSIPKKKKPKIKKRTKERISPNKGRWYVSVTFAYLLEIVLAVKLSPFPPPHTPSWVVGNYPEAQSG